METVADSALDPIQAVTDILDAGGGDELFNVAEKNWIPVVGIEAKIKNGKGGMAIRGIHVTVDIDVSTQTGSLNVYAETGR